MEADSSVGYKRFTRHNTGTYITRTNISGKMERHKEKTNESLQKHERRSSRHRGRHSETVIKRSLI